MRTEKRDCHTSFAMTYLPGQQTGANKACLSLGGTKQSRYLSFSLVSSPAECVAHGQETGANSKERLPHFVRNDKLAQSTNWNKQSLFVTARYEAVSLFFVLADFTTSGGYGARSGDRRERCIPPRVRHAEPLRAD